MLGKISILFFIFHKKELMFKTLHLINIINPIYF